ncbi:MAG: ABC transporter ATP-binding protein [Ruminococcaceae bacterium]|nr:ABC transporter ATP-binding protein [Oscillospiraceae bacterium]
MANNDRYLSGKEVRAIAKANAREIKRLEAYKNRKAPESEFLAEMRDPSNILEIEDLHTFFYTEQGVVQAVNGVSYDVPRNAVVGVVGESGCGKSVTAMSVMRLIQGPAGQIVDGSIRFKAYDYKRDAKGNPVLKEGSQTEYEMEEKVYDIAKMPVHEIHRIRGKQVAMIFQEPMTSLNPVFTIGEQLDEVTFIHTPGATKEQARAKSEEMLRLVGIIPENVYNAFPHELSGGMRQRVMIAMALAAEPRLIIADEPTTALDVTIQAQILDLLQDIKNKIDGSILLITHDLGVIAEMADYVVVMYAGKVIEKGTVQEIFRDPRHPYTIGLQKSKPTMTLDDGTELYNIPGNVPNPINMPSYCYFKERCDKCTAKCAGDYPCMVQVSPTHFVACHLYSEEENHG